MSRLRAGVFQFTDVYEGGPAPPESLLRPAQAAMPQCSFRESLAPLFSIRRQDTRSSRTITTRHQLTAASGCWPSKARSVECFNFSPASGSCLNLQMLLSIRYVAPALQRCFSTRIAQRRAVFHMRRARPSSRRSAKLRRAGQSQQGCLRQIDRRRNARRSRCFRRWWSPPGWPRTVLPESLSARLSLAVSGIC